jgi:hypothetical protein
MFTVTIPSIARQKETKIIITEVGAASIQSFFPSIAKFCTDVT